MRKGLLQRFKKSRAEEADEDDIDVGLEAELLADALPVSLGSTGSKRKAARPQEHDDDEDEDDEDEEDDDDEDDDKAPTVRPRGINNEAGLLQCVKELQPTDQVPWMETLDIVSSVPVAVASVDDDFQRELAFYKQALEAALLGKPKVLAAGVAFDRPEDFFAEMIKSDDHMRKVRQHLADEAQQIKRSEEAAKQRALRKYGKKVQTEKLQERQKQKSKDLDKIKMIRKGRGNVEKVLAGKDDDFGVTVDNSVGGGGGGGGKGAAAGGKGATKSPKRHQKDTKYGHGGKKRGTKNNTAESSGDVSKFSVRKNKEPPKSFGKGNNKGPHAGKQKRPGKTARHNQANKRQQRK